MRTPKRIEIKVTEFIREEIDGKKEVVCIDWLFQDKSDALDKMFEINARKPFCAPFLTYVMEGKEND